MASLYEPEEAESAREHLDEMEATIVEDAVDLYDLVSGVEMTAADVAAELEFVDEDEGSLEDVDLAVEMLDELLGDKMLYLNRQKRRVEGLLEEYRMISADLEEAGF
ncbi:hypothetical protein HUG10_21045 (plasmid) [Halorarum halophilum]|uniref:Uncharacterized protein n=1 Tax=Halorarum halophilum TaxID=2743090 RepID=A0A7D5KPA4_9EURY|nr:hypothetical protein [Halobaculum halophilum]QLG30075.1 hypothetical protein HUG10_21045 [Halobaculum halophilum]